MAGSAEFGHSSLLTRMSEGTSRAKVGGATLGRPFGMTYHQRQEALAGKAAGEPIREIARNCNVSPRTISRS